MPTKVDRHVHSNPGHQTVYSLTSPRTGPPSTPNPAAFIEAFAGDDRYVDVSVKGVVPGLSVHQELGLLVEAGLTPFEALATGTRNAAQITGRMGAGSTWGTVETGQRADLILLPNNPLEDVTHTQNRLGVMVRGQWFTQAELDELVDEFVATYRADGALTSN